MYSQPDLHLSVHHGERDIVHNLSDHQIIRDLQASGVGVSDDCLSTYQNLKLRKRPKYITFKLDDSGKEIVVDKSSESSDYDDFIADLPEDQCRWAVYDFEFEKEGGGKRNKLCFFSWSVAFVQCHCSLVLIQRDFIDIRAPDTAKIKEKMLYASSKEVLRKSFVGIAVEIQSTEYSEVTYESGSSALLRMRCYMLISTCCSS